MAYKIFLSHSSPDADWVKWIAVNAKDIGVDVYLYEHDVQPGMPIAEKIKQAIGDSDALVVLLTSNSQFSAYVQQEIGFTEASGKPIIPLVQPGIAQQSLAMLEGREYILFDFYDPNNALVTLLTYLQQLKEAKENQRAMLMGLGGLIFLGWLFGREK
ncbi:toll/interleukin-1 receptor domain-containing protein [Dehalococcoidia bacterium]|nr:toll/interleukin-1 receptor domain-containing protein [Dehalococcoidia bacterium]MCL0097775.1 toll/interleukin-1 receptor domain-containing protein [Dehalococcoidia bacterium]